MKILITGGNGLIGSGLAVLLKNEGHEVVLMGRKRTYRANSEFKTLFWDIENQELDIDAIKNTNAVIHLAGENISDKRWTKKQKKIIEESRVKSAEFLFSQFKKYGKMPEVYVSSSAIGYYGSFTSSVILSEDNPAGKDFLAGVCEKWEKSTQLFQNEGVRTVIIRTGVVLSPNGGAFIKLYNLVKNGLGSSLGNGKQYIPWIHIDDIVSIFYRALTQQNMSGVFNGVAPFNLTNSELIRIIAKKTGRRIILPAVPELLVRLIFGERSIILLKGTRISPDKIISSGFKFKFPEPEKAIENLIEKLK
ncbi:MAG: TIGR01777 family oxidoreductase [Bacteroidales bacterium]